VVTVSTRGSCESLVSTLMLTVVYSLMRGWGWGCTSYIHQL
jgi:hypothetical protein